MCTEFPIPSFMRFRHVLFWEFLCPAWAVASCSSDPQAEGNSLKLSRKMSMNDGMENSVVKGLTRFGSDVSGNEVAEVRL